MVGTGPQTNDVFTLTLERSLADQLADIDLSTDDIELISISHSHFDHSGQAALFSNSQWLVNQNELDHMFASPESSAQNAAFADLSKIIISGDHDIFGDGSVTILDLPGHTPGHTALQVNLAQAGPILLTGDLYHRTLSREQKHVPRFNTDEPATRLSMDRFEALATASGARVIIQHEPKDVATLPVAPDFLQ
jgi:glyoxylase-like metal-dependent hydrolase (beta-lactamase superfamily II)